MNEKLKKKLKKDGRTLGVDCRRVSSSPDDEGITSTRMAVLMQKKNCSSIGYHVVGLGEEEKIKGESGRRGEEE